MTPIKKVYKDYFKSLKQEHPLLYDKFMTDYEDYVVY